MRTIDGRKHGSAHIEPRLRGVIRPHPQIVVDSLPCKEFFRVALEKSLAVFELATLVASVSAPVREIVSGCSLDQTTRDGWDRRLSIPESAEPPNWFFPPVLVSARTLWHQREHLVEVFGRAYVIDGAHRLELAARTGRPCQVPVLALFGLEEESELRLRADLRRWDPPPPHGYFEPRFDTSTPRLHVSDAWVRVRVDSDPFVVPTARGYAPALLVRRRRASQREHLLIGAVSLAKPLEELRLSHGTLVGLWLEIRKEGPDKLAQYVLRRTEQTN